MREVLTVCCLVLGLQTLAKADYAYDETYARQYLKLTDYSQAALMKIGSMAKWNYVSNITDRNMETELAIGSLVAKQFELLMQETLKFPWQSFKDHDIVRQFSKMTGIGIELLSRRSHDALGEILAEMSAIFGKGKVCDYKNQSKCDLNLDPDISEIFAKSRDPEELKYYWKAWRDATGKTIGKFFPTYVKLSNAKARKFNFKDTSQLWISAYDTDHFPEMVEKLWEQLRPLYLQLHAYVRRKLREAYGKDVVSKKRPIPAHLFGNMWAQDWVNILDLTMPYPNKTRKDVTKAMIDQGFTPLKMVKLSEEFYVSLNLSKMTDSFWKKSIFERPKDGRELICHASAWDFYGNNDFRIKMCTVVSFEDLKVIHHEMGHIQYYMQYKDKPVIYRSGANPGFHEAIGDTMALSVMTPKHLRKIGLLETSEDDKETDINTLFQVALEKIAFLPFGLLIDTYRWGIFRGETKPENYNCKWWQLREKYQGIEPPVDRSENDFDAGAKFHVADSDPYIAYFVSFVIQFQFHKSLCEIAGEYKPNDPKSQPLFQCDIYQSKAAGNHFKDMLSLGSSKPWPEVMEKITGKPDMDASALLEYFSTLQTWLEAENKRTGEYIGWKPTKRACSSISN